MQNHKTYITTLPDFIQIQKTSFCWFISQGLSEELENFSSGAVCLVVASDIYKEEDYIEDFKEYLNYNVKLK